MKVTKNEKLLQISSGLFPVLNFPLSSPGVVNERSVGQDVANEYYKERDFALLKYLYHFRFATFEQLCALLNVKTEEEASFRARLQQLISRRAINKFIMSNDKNDTADDGTLLNVYTLEYSGLSILSHKYSRNNVLNYEIAMNIADSLIVARKLFAVNIYLDLIKNLGHDAIISFDASPDFNLNKVYGGEHGRANSIHYCPGFTFSVRNKNGDVKSYICDVFSKEEMGQDLIDELNFTNEYLPKTKAYMLGGADDKKGAPTYLLFLADQEDVVTAVQGMIAYASNVKTYRLATEDSIKNGLGEAGAFYKLDTNTNKVVAVTMSAFKKEA